MGGEFNKRLVSSSALIESQYLAKRDQDQKPNWLSEQNPNEDRSIQYSVYAKYTENCMVINTLIITSEM